MNFQNVMQYLCQKLESHSRNIAKKRQNLFNSLTPETFAYQKNDITNFLNDLEEDLRQGAFAIKTLINENINLQINNAKQLQLQKSLYNEMKQSNNSLVEENENLRLKMTHDSKKKHFSAFTGRENFKNVRNILYDMEVNKKKLKTAVSKHFEEEKAKEKDNLKESEPATDGVKIPIRIKNTINKKSKSELEERKKNYSMEIKKNNLAKTQRIPANQANITFRNDRQKKKDFIQYTTPYGRYFTDFKEKTRTNTKGNQKN